MPYELDHRLVVGVASSALFDLTDSHHAFLQGLDHYRTYQEEHADEPLAPGVAFPFIERLLGLNDLAPADRPVEVFVLSKNDPVTGLRVMKSIEHHGLSISRAHFTEGTAPYAYIRALNISLFLSGNRADVDVAIALGHTAGVVLGSAAVGTSEPNDHAVRIAFDFDGVLAGDEAEQIYQSAGIEEFRVSEVEQRATPLNPGPLHAFVTALTRIQRLELAKLEADPSYVPRIRISIVTARDAPAHERAVTTLRAWGFKIDDAFFLGGVAKDRVLRVLQPHIFFDDQDIHLSPVADSVASVLIPSGIMNRPASPPTAALGAE